MHMLPYKVLVALLPQLAHDQIGIPIRLFNFLLSVAAQSVDFDEDDYLRRNPDVALAVRQGKWTSGKDHYIAVGYFEGRPGGEIPLSPSWYLKNNPDVAMAISNGEWKSAQEHYLKHGIYEWRIPSEESVDEMLQWKRLLLEPLHDQVIAAGSHEVPGESE